MTGSTKYSHQSMIMKVLGKYILQNVKAEKKKLSKKQNKSKLMFFSKST